MSSNNWMLEMDKMLAVFSSQATSSLINMRKCFEDTGRTFDKEFKELFFAASNNCLAAVYSKFEMEQMFNATAVKSGNDEIEDRDTVSSEHAPDAELVEIENNEPNGIATVFLVVDSSGEEDLIFAPTTDILRNVNASENEISNVILNQNGVQYNIEASEDNDKDKVLVKMEAKTEEMNYDDDVPLILIEANRRIKIESNEKLIGESLSGNTNKNEVNHKECGAKDGNHFGLSSRKEPKLTKPRSADKSATKVSMAMTSSSSTAAPAQMFSKVAKMYQCQVCKYFSPNRTIIKIHVRIHTGEKPYRCNRCGKCFAQSSSLKYHEKVHAKETAFHCSGCFRGYSKKNKKDEHEKECKLPRYECYVCKKVSFVHKGHLKYHMQTHIGEKPFRCEICLKRFSRKNGLKYHLNFVHNKNRHQA